MNPKIFKFLFKDKMIPVHPFDKLLSISKKIRDILIFSNEHQYEIESKVSEETVDNFIKYLIDDEIPEILISNINEYETLSYEFETLTEMINQKKEEYGKYLITIQGLKSEDKNMKKIYENEIIENLNEYIEKYGIELMKIPIETLYNIFNKATKKFTKHNETYELIKNFFNQTKNSNIFILLDFLDGNKLTRNNMEESYSLCNERNGHMPKIDFSCFGEIFEKQRKQDEKLDELVRIIQKQAEKYDELFKEKQNQDFKNAKMIQNLQNKINDLTNVIETNSANHREMIENISKKNEEEQRKLQQIIDKILNEQHQQQEEYKNLLNKEQENSKSNKDLQDQITNLNKNIENNSENISKQNELEQIKLQKIIEQLEERISINEKNEEVQNTIEDLKRQNMEQNSKISMLETQIQNLDASKIQTNCKPFKAEFDMNVPGILQRLKNNEKSPFDKLFIASQSSNDVYNVIDPETKDEICIANIGQYIEIELEKSITIIGIKIISSRSFFLKSFDIEINGEKVKNIKEANELNKMYGEMIVNFDSLICQKVRIINTGKNWDKNSNSILIKNIELISNESTYSKGVFYTLVSQSENHDPHKCHVFIYASIFDYNKIHSIDSNSSLSTQDKQNSWFQIEFTNGKVILNGFRLKRSDPQKLKSYKIICTDDVYKPEQQWITLIKIEEQSNEEHKMLDIYKFSQPSPPTKYVRLIQIGNNWSNETYLKFKHLDFFGSYISDF